jgi:hypothetical protein
MPRRPPWGGAITTVEAVPAHRPERFGPRAFSTCPACHAIPIAAGSVRQVYLFPFFQLFTANRGRERLWLGKNSAPLFSHSNESSTRFRVCLNERYRRILTNCCSRPSQVRNPRIGFGPVSMPIGSRAANSTSGSCYESRARSPCPHSFRWAVCRIHPVRHRLFRGRDGCVRPCPDDGFHASPPFRFVPRGRGGRAHRPSSPLFRVV